MSSTPPSSHAPIDPLRAATFDALIVIVDDVVAAANARAAALFGYEAAEALMGTPVVEITAPESREQMQALAGSGATAASRIYLRHRTGQVVLAEIQTQPYEHDGRPGLLAALRDVTRERAVHVTLRERETYYRALIETSLDVIAVIDAERVLQYANPALGRVLGYDEPVAGQRLVDWVHPDDVAPVERVLARAFEAPNTRQQVTCRVRHADGSWRILEAVGNTLQINGDDELVLVLGARDVTARVQTQQKLKDREAQLDRAQRIARLASWTFNLTSGVFTGSDQLFHLYGLAPQPSLSYETLRGYVHADDRMLLDDALQHARETFEPLDLIHRIVRADGQERILHVRGEAELEGHDLVMFGTAQDVTEVRQMEAELRWSERRFRAIFDSMFQFLWVLQPDGTLVEANQTALDFGGVHAEEILGTPFWQAPWWQPDSKVQAWLRAAVSEAAQGTLVRATIDVHGVDGRLATIDFSIKPVTDADGTIVLLVPEGRDITEQMQSAQALRESEARYRSVVDAMAEGLLLVDAERGTTACNASAERILGVEAATLCASRPAAAPYELLHRDGTPMDAADYPAARTLATGTPCDQEIVGVRRPDGSRIWISVNTEPLTDGDTAAPYAAVVTFHDVTATLEREEALRTSRQRLRALTAQLHSAQEAERSRLAREVHDILGQAMTALRMDAKWLKTNGPDEETYQARIDGTIQLVDETIQTVRRISHELRPGVLDHFGLGAALDWQTEQFAQRSECTCRFTDATDGLSFDLNTDLATALFRIFQEALTNVVRHAEASAIEARLATTDEGYLLLEVTDDGRGIDADHLDQPNSLGLLNMRERVLPWDGEVEVTSTPGNGTTVSVRVPLKNATSDTVLVSD